MSKLKASLIAFIAFILGITIGWWFKAFDTGITIHYMRSGYDQIQSDRNELREHIINRNAHPNDLVALQNFNDTRGTVFTKKYENWSITPLGLVQFGTAGNIESLCFSDLNEAFVCDDFIQIDKNYRTP